MTGCEADDPLLLLAAARGGQPEALGALTELYRNYLYLLARVQLDRRLSRRVSPSDLVQETLIKACRKFGQFQGNSERELLAWLRAILINALKSAIERDYLAERRDARREISLDAVMSQLEGSVAQLDRLLVSQISSPSRQAERRELAALVADQLAALPEDYREVIVLRNLEGIDFAEVARRMGRSEAAARALWVRALRRLREITTWEDLT